MPRIPIFIPEMFVKEGRMPHLIPGFIEVNEHGVLIGLGVDKEHRNFSSDSNVIEQIASCLATNIRYELLRVSSSHDNLPDCISIEYK
ncbi:MAG: hypothetical protein WCT08_04700 [Patescibacteria group bacterium]|jgi:hypothetical protein